MIRLNGRRILVTGASMESGIGRAAAEAFTREGARVFLTDIDQASVTELQKKLGVKGLACDLSDPALIPAMVAAAADALGGLDGVCNVAGTGRPQRIEETTLEDWSHVLAINLTAPFLICREALPHLKQGNRPAIVNVASASALLPVGSALSSYVASKAGLVGLSKTMASELAPSIRVNVVCPGAVDTRILPDTIRTMANDPAHSPYALKRLAQPAEIADALVYLMSDEASYITGAVLAVDGGRSFH